MKKEISFVRRSSYVLCITSELMSVLLQLVREACLDLFIFIFYFIFYVSNNLGPCDLNLVYWII